VPNGLLIHPHICCASWFSGWSLIRLAICHSSLLVLSARRATLDGFGTVFFLLLPFLFNLQGGDRLAADKGRVTALATVTLMAGELGEWKME
jgi:hypothetical protein